MSDLVILAFVAACVLSGGIYFDRWQMARPPIGVMNLRDIAINLVLIIFVPLLYMALPDWVLLALFTLAILGIIYQVFEPVLHKWWVLWLTALGSVGGNLALNHYIGTLAPTYLLVNDWTMVVVVLGVTNLWAQSGMKARDATILAGLLAAYDFIFTSQLTVTSDLFNHLDLLPLAPIIAWGSGPNRSAIGLGDLLLATLFPLVMRKGYGQIPGILAQGLAIMSMALISVLVPPTTLFPSMLVLSPVMIAQYSFWRRQYGPERTNRQYRNKVPFVVTSLNGASFPWE